MSEEVKTLEDLGDVVAGTPAAPVEVEVSTPAEPQIDEHGRSYATGKRKNAIARVWRSAGRASVRLDDRPPFT